MSASQCRYCHHTACLVTVCTSLEWSVCLGTEAPGSRAARFPRGPASHAGAPGSPREPLLCGVGLEVPLSPGHVTQLSLTEPTWGLLLVLFIYLFLPRPYKFCVRKLLEISLMFSSKIKRLVFIPSNFCSGHRPAL